MAEGMIRTGIIFTAGYQIEVGSVMSSTAHLDTCGPPRGPTLIVRQLIQVVLGGPI